MSTINNYFQQIGIHSLDILAVVDSNVATIGSVSDKSLINFYTNLNANNYFTMGMSNSSFIIRDKNDKKGGLYYNNDTLQINDINLYNTKLDNITYNTKQITYPNSNVSISSYIFSTSGSVGANFSSNIFDLNTNSYWRSENIFNATGNLNYALNLPRFTNIHIETDSTDSFLDGCWVSVSLPMSIIPVRYRVQAINYYLQFAPTHFILLGYDYVLQKWRKINETSYFNWNTDNYETYIDIDVNKQFLYDKFTLLINQVNGGLYAQIGSLEIFAKPIISINNSIRISDNNIYGINTINANELRLSSNSITSFQGMIDYISAGAIITVSSNLTLNWSNLPGSLDTFAFKNVGINTAKPSTALNVKGGLSYTSKYIENSISLYPHGELNIGGDIIPLNKYSSSYIKIGELSYTNNEYFNFDIYCIEIPVNSTDYPYVNYSQKLNVYGVCNPNINKIYYTNEVNRTYLPLDSTTLTKLDRITNVTYNYIGNKLEFHIKYNDLLNITSVISPKHFSNVIYLDFTNTRGNLNNNFIVSSNIVYPSGSVPINAIKIKDTIIDDTIINSNIVYSAGNIITNNILSDKIYLTGFNSNTIPYINELGLIKSTNVTKTQIDRLNYISNFSNYTLITNDIGLITPSSVTLNMLYGLSNVYNSANKIVKTNDNGILTYTDISETQLNRLNTIKNSSNRVIISDNTGLLSYSTVTNNELLGLSNVLYSSNKAIITNEKGVLINSTVNKSQLERLYDISFSSNKVLYTDGSGLINYSPVTYDMLIGLSNIKNKTKKFVITDDNGFLTTTDITAGNSQNLDNILTLYNYTSSFAYTYSNIVIGSNINNNSLLYVNGLTTTNNIGINSNLSIGDGNIKWNKNTNTFQYNNLSTTWKQFGENIFTFISKYPHNSLYTNYSVNNVTKNQTIYNLSLNNYDNYGNGAYILKTDIADDTNTNNRKVYNIFSHSPLNNYWKTDTNFDFNSLYGYDNTKYLEQNSTKYGNTSNGAYFVLTIPDKILLSYYVIYYKFDANSPYLYENTINTFRLFGYDSDNDYWDLIDEQINITKWDNNFKPNIFKIKNIYNKKIYNTFSLCIIKTNTTTDNNYAVINGIEFYGNNNYYGNIIYNITSNTSSYNNSNLYTKSFTSPQSIILGNNNIGIDNYNPSSLLSIGNEIYTSNYTINSETILNLNHSCNLDNNINLGIKVLNLTRPSNNNTRGIRASHILNTWVNNSNTLNTRYDINLSHLNYDNENLGLSLLSDGRCGLGIAPNISNYLEQGISIISNLYLYNTPNSSSKLSSNFVSIGVNNITSNYNIILPDKIGNQYNFLQIKKIANNAVANGFRLPSAVLEWVSPNNIFYNVDFAKIGYQSVTSCNINPVKLQVAGHCIIGSNYLNDISSSYINDNSLIVTGRIYTTHDVTTDSDISYKYDLMKIDNPLEKIKQLNGYTFLRNDVTPSEKDKRFCGLIAQEVNKVLPEVITVKHDNKLRVMYNNLAALFVEAFKETELNINNINFKVNMLYMFFGVMVSYLYMKS
jgi:hypothetical protein